MIMRLLLSCACFFAFAIAYAQPPRLDLEPIGFAPIEVPIPATPNERLIEATRTWAAAYNRRESSFDITDVTDNSLVVTAFKKNAFFYRNRGEAFEHSINYTMQITFNETSYSLQFNVEDIFTNIDKLIEYKLPDYFTPAGNLKEGYTDLEVSLEDTVNDIVVSHYDYIINYR